MKYVCVGMRLTVERALLLVLAHGSMLLLPRHYIPSAGESPHECSTLPLPGAAPGRARLPSDCARWMSRLGAFSGKVETGFPSENATNAEKLEHVPFPLKLNML
jgi:hypothetical protein